MIGESDSGSLGIVNCEVNCSLCQGKSLFCNCPKNLSKRRVQSTSQLLGNHLVDFATRPQAKLLVVEGNIGVGKTTLAKKLSDALGYKMFVEPTSENPYLGELTDRPFLFTHQFFLLFFYFYFKK